MDSTSDAIKALALEGSFGAISEKYGAKKCSKAENYVKVKLDALADKVEKGVSLDGVPYATPFMMFAVAHKDEELGAVAKLFLAPAQVEELENSQLSASITPSSQSKNTPSQSSSAENNLETQLNPIATVIVTPMRAPSVVKAKGFQPPSAQKDTVAEVKIVKPSSSSDKKGKKVKSDGKKVVAVKSAKPQKVPKDPNAPKGAKGSYMFFSAEMRADILSEDPKMSCVEVAKETGARWKALSDDEKRPYADLAAADKERYTTEMAAYREEHPESATAPASSAKPTKKKRESAGVPKNASKRPAAAKRKEEKEDESESQQAGDEEEEGRDAEGGGGVGDDIAAADEDPAAEEAGEEPAPASSARLITKRKAATAAVASIAKSARGDDIIFAAMGTDTKTKQESPLARAKQGVLRKGAKSVTPTKKGAAVLTHFKQKDLDAEEDLLHTEFNPRETSNYPPAIEFKKNMTVALALEPYRCFLSQLPADSVDSNTMQEIQRICAATSPVVHCTVKTFRTVPSGIEAPAGEVAASYTLLGVSAGGGREYKVLHADISSPLLTCDSFLVEERQFQDSLKVPWLLVGAQVKRLFATEDPDLAEWQEGSIYHIQEDLLSNPYGAVKIAWLQQERGTNAWVYSYTQTDSDCSPWDLVMSSYVLLQNIRPPTVPRALLVGTLDPALIVEYLKTFDAASQFLLDMSQCQEADYCAMFPRAEDRWDLPRISRLCRQGRYSASCDDTSTLSSSSSLGSKNRRAGVSAVAAGAVDPRAELGLLALFLDLQRMIAQSKAFNACNAAFLPWRLADMLQCAVQRLKRVLAKQRGIACLQHSLEEDEYERAQQAQETQAVDL